MIEEDIEIPMKDGAADAVLFQPDAQSKGFGVIFLPDIGGIRPAFRKMAHRLAEEGFTVLMPNLFFRTAKPPVFKWNPDEGEEVMRQRMSVLTAPLTPETLAEDGSVYVDFLTAHSSGESLGVVGYCYAGAVAMRVAAARPDKIVAAASFHGGRLYTDSPTSPHLLLPKIDARLYFAHAVNDRSMNAEAIQAFEQALAAWDGPFKSETYEGALHGWTALDSPVYNEPQAERAFGQLLALLNESFASAAAA